MTYKINYLWLNNKQKVPRQKNIWMDYVYVKDDGYEWSAETTAERRTWKNISCADPHVVRKEQEDDEFVRSEK